MRVSVLLALLFSAAWVLHPAAQAWPPDCPSRLGEDDDTWEQRCKQEASIESYGRTLEAQRQAEAQRSALNAEPALPATKNPLLGRWSLPAVGAGNPNDLLAEITGLLQGLECGPLIGVSELEFLPDRMISIAGDGEQSGAPVNYRGRKNGVFVVTAPYRALLFFHFLSADRVQLGSLESCTLTRQSKVVAGKSATPATAAPAAIAAQRAFACPDGSVAVVLSCDNESASANCTVEFPTLPKLYGRHPYEIAQRGAIANRVKDCKAGSIRYDSEGKAVFVPDAQ